jgi:hypothetical protein
MKRAEEAARPGFIRPLKRSQQAFDYPVYFNNQYIENKLSRIRLRRPTTGGVKKFASSEIGKSQLQFQQPQRLKFNHNSSSSSNSEFIRVLNRRRKLINMSKLQQQQQQHRFDAG